MSYQPKIIEREKQYVLSIRTRTAVKDLPAALGESYGAIASYLGQLGETPTGAPFAGYFNMDMQNLDVEIGFPVSKSFPGKGNIQSGRIMGGKFGTCIHTGPYNAIESAYNALQHFIGESGFQASGVAYEFYLNDPNETPEAQLQTQILFPLV